MPLKIPCHYTVHASSFDVGDDCIRVYEIDAIQIAHAICISNFSYCTSVLSQYHLRCGCAF